MKRLIDVLDPERKLRTIEVKCCHCEMTMWSSSENAFSDGEYIYCRQCADQEEGK